MTSIDFQRSQALQPANRLLKTSSKFACAFIFLVLSACSGQDAATSASSTSSTSQTVAQQTSKELAQNPAVLTLTAPAPNTVLSSQIQAQSSIQPQATTANFSPVTRIQNTSLPGSYFFTIYNSERVAALAGNPSWKQEGPAFWAATVAEPGLSPVYRFRNKINGSYLYTIYESERADIVANYAATFALEGPAWFASQTPLAGWSPLYRFRNKTNGTYLFSAFEAEKDNIVANFTSTFELEGVAYYVWQNIAAQSDVTCGLTNFQAEMLAVVNAKRAAGAVCNGVAYPAVGALVWNSQLQQAATVHSTDMSTKDFFAHTGSDGSSLIQRLPAAGYSYRSAGENIAAGYTSVTQVVTGWMDSTTGHCENIMKATHRDIGVSCKIYAPSTYKTYWTMELGSR
jgi:uncharacterized protein YkwD